MKNILLPTDFSENSWNAIVYALCFLENTRCNFYIMHVQIDHTDIDIKQKFDTLRNRIHQTFPKNKLHHITTVTCCCAFVKAIRDEVENKHIDMMIIGAKGTSSSQSAIIGHYAENIITKVKCNVLIVPENATYTEFDKVAFPTDFTLASDIQTLTPIATLLDKTSTALYIVYINKVTQQLNHQQQVNKAILEDFLEDLKYSFHFLTNHNIETALEDFTEKKHINLMIMAAKNLNYFKQILFHSKVASISYHTNIPFLVLHE